MYEDSDSPGPVYHPTYDGIRPRIWGCALGGRKLSSSSDATPGPEYEIESAFKATHRNAPKSSISGWTRKNQFSSQSPGPVYHPNVDGVKIRAPAHAMSKRLNYGVKKLGERSPGPIYHPPTSTIDTTKGVTMAQRLKYGERKMEERSPGPVYQPSDHFSSTQKGAPSITMASRWKKDSNEDVSPGPIYNLASTDPHSPSRGKTIAKKLNYGERKLHERSPGPIYDIPASLSEKGVSIAPPRSYNRKKLGGRSPGPIYAPSYSGIRKNPRASTMSFRHGASSSSGQNTSPGPASVNLPEPNRGNGVTIAKRLNYGAQKLAERSPGPKYSPNDHYLSKTTNSPAVSMAKRYGSRFESQSPGPIYNVDVARGGGGKTIAGRWSYSPASAVTPGPKYLLHSQRSDGVTFTKNKRFGRLNGYRGGRFRK